MVEAQHLADVTSLTNVFAHGIANWTRPGTVELPGALPRLCAPVRCNGLLLGYLWLIGSFGEEERAAAAEAANSAGTVLYRQLLLHERFKARHEAILRELVSADAALRAQVVEDSRAEQLFGDEATHFTVLAVQTSAAIAAPQEVAFEAAVEDGVRAVTDDVALLVANRSRGWILLIQRVSPSRADHVDRGAHHRAVPTTDRCGRSPGVRRRRHRRSAGRCGHLPSGGVARRSPHCCCPVSATWPGGASWARTSCC